MGRKNTLNKAIRALLIANPAASNSEIVEQTGASPRTVQYIRANLRKTGILEPVRGQQTAPEGAKVMVTEPTIASILPQAADLTPEMLSDDAIREKLLHQVQLTAFDPKVSAQTRLDAAQVWVKLRDIAREKELGPGLPRTEEEIIDRLVRIMQGCGAKLVIKALDRAFQRKEPEYEPLEPASTPQGTEEAPDSE